MTLFHRTAVTGVLLVLRRAIQVRPGWNAFLTAQLVGDDVARGLFVTALFVAVGRAVGELTVEPSGGGGSHDEVPTPSIAVGPLATAPASILRGTARAGLLSKGSVGTTAPLGPGVGV